MNCIIIFALLIVDNVKFNVYVNAWFDMSRVVFGQFVLLVFLTLLSSERKRFKMCLKKKRNGFTILVCQEYTIYYANLAYLMLACRQNTLQGMLGVIVERYEIFA